MKVSWIDHGQYGRILGPFLVRCNVSLPEIMKMKRFGYLVRQNIGDPGSIKLRNVFSLISVMPKLLQLPYGIKKTRAHVPLLSQVRKNKIS